VRKLRAFTLLETLIVVTILGFVLVLVAPAFTYARGAAKRTSCLSNIKQVCQAMKNYLVQSGGQLPPDDMGNPPWGAKNPSDPKKVLNRFLNGDGYKVLKCPNDEASRAGSVYSYFDTLGYSYGYACSDGQGISSVEGTVCWQENAIAEMPSIPNMLENYLNGTGYYGSGPEDIPCPDGQGAQGQYRARDVTRDQLYQPNGTTDQWHAVVLPALTAMAAKFQGNQGGTYLDTSGLSVPFSIKVNPPAFSSTTDPSEPPNRKYTSEYVASSGMPVSIPPPNPSRWNTMNCWSRKVYNCDYWQAASKKVWVMDGDACLPYTTPGANGAYPTVGKGFWHAYPYIPDPSNPADKSKYHVRCHAGFLDGHAEAIELNQYTTIDRNAHKYY
jgi:Tfp pilus assembly protein PilE